MEEQIRKDQPMLHISFTLSTTHVGISVNEINIKIWMG
jgi:hypothetical protein